MNKNFEKLKMRGYNKYGFDEEGFDINGFDIDGYDKNGMHKFSKGSDVKEKGYIYSKNELHEKSKKEVNLMVELYELTKVRMIECKKSLIEVNYDKSNALKLLYNKNLISKEMYCELIGSRECHISRNLKKSDINLVELSEVLYEKEDKIKKSTFRNDVELCERSKNNNDYIGAISHLRRACERYLDELYDDSLGNSSTSLKGKSLFEKIEMVSKINALKDSQIQVLHRIRRKGNCAIHYGEATEELANELLNNIKEIIEDR